MKTNKSFVLRSVADEHLLIPTGAAAARIQGLITLNESGALLYRKLCEGCSEDALISALTDEYEVSAEEARTDVSEFLSHMRQLGIIQED